jgi:hypothetical protein
MSSAPTKPTRDLEFSSQYLTAIPVIFRVRESTMRLERQAHVQVPLLARAMGEACNKEIYPKYNPPKTDAVAEAMMMHVFLNTHPLGLDLGAQPISANATLKECLQHLEVALYVPPRGQPEFEDRLMTTVSVDGRVLEVGPA